MILYYNYCWPILCKNLLTSQEMFSFAQNGVTVFFTAIISIPRL